MTRQTGPFGADRRNVERLNRLIDRLSDTIMEMTAHRGSLLVSWLETKLNYIRRENVPERTRGFYDRGQIVHVNFGFNVGSEEGGGRPAVVVWASAEGGTITVVPLTSLKPEKAEKDLAFAFHVDLEDSLEDGVISIAKVQQIRAVSKLRVSPLIMETETRRYKINRLSDDQLDRIDETIRLLYTRQAP